MRFTFIFTLLTVTSLTACAVPQTSELRSQPANEQFIINSPLGCIYEGAVEHVSSRIALSEPNFTWYLDPDGQYGWFRQPLTLVQLRTVTQSSTEVRRSQTPSAAAFGQANDLLDYLRTESCSSK